MSLPAVFETPHGQKGTEKYTLSCKSIERIHKYEAHALRAQAQQLLKDADKHEAISHQYFMEFEASREFGREVARNS